MSWTDPHSRYFRNRSTEEILPTCDDDGCPVHSSSQFYYGDEDWEEVRITPVDPNNEIDVVTVASEVGAASTSRNMADVIEEAARVGLEALDEHHKMVREAVRKACNFDLGPDQDRSVEVWTIARALADAGLLVGPCDMSPEQVEEIDDVLSDYGRECENSVTSFRAPTPDLRTARERILSALGFTYGGGGE